MLFLGLMFSSLSYAEMICSDSVMEGLTQKADIIVLGEVIKFEKANKSFGRLRMATVKIEKIVKGNNLPNEVIVEFDALDKTLEADVQDEQLDTLGERGTAYLTKLPNNHYKILNGMCGWKFLEYAK